jgi:hypothetical protein
MQIFLERKTRTVPRCQYLITTTHYNGCYLYRCTGTYLGLTFIPQKLVLAFLFEPCALEPINPPTQRDSYTLPSLLYVPRSNAMFAWVGLVYLVLTGSGLVSHNQRPVVRLDNGVSH